MFHLICKIGPIVLTKIQTIGFFTSIGYQTPPPPRNVIKQIPNSIQDRLSKNSSNEDFSTQQNVNTSMLWRKVDSKSILNTAIINDKNQKGQLEILFGLTHHPTKQYIEMLQKCFFEWSIDIFQGLLDYMKFLIGTHWRLVAAVCKICSKYTKGIIVR